MSNKPEIIKGIYKKVEIDSALAGKSIHIVFVADGGPSMYMNHVPGGNGLPYGQAAMLANRVNLNNETGTLHPHYKVTIVPLSVFGARNDTGNVDVMRTNIRDVFVANEVHIHSAEIFFCFEPRPDFDYQLAIDTIYEEAEQLYQYVQRISIL